jgi:glutathione S-transferase
MRLIGPFGSPYTRRVAITLKFYGLEVDHTKIVPFGDGKAKLRDVNPLARIPALELDDGACIVESGTILDYLDTLVDAESSLTPRTGPARSQVLNYVSIAS